MSSEQIRELVDAIIAQAKETALGRAKAHGADFDEADFLAGVSAALVALRAVATGGEGDCSYIPPRWIFGTMGGRPVLLPDKLHEQLTRTQQERVVEHKLFTDLLALVSEVGSRKNLGELAEWAAWLTERYKNERQDLGLIPYDDEEEEADAAPSG